MDNVLITLLLGLLASGVTYTSKKFKVSTGHIVLIISLLLGGLWVVLTNTVSDDMLAQIIASFWEVLGAATTIYILVDKFAKTK